MYRLSILAVLVFIAGCAFRAETVPDEIEPVYNLYSRNFVVAAPTAAANAACGAAGGAFLLLATGQEAGIYVGAFLGAHACGAVVGLPFIPLSYLCDENPWTVVDQQFQPTWTCDGSEAWSSQL